MIEFESIHQSIKLPNKPLGEPKENEALFLSHLNGEAFDGTLNSKNQQYKDGNKASVSESPLTTELLSLWKKSANIGSSAISYGLYEDQRVLPQFGGDNHVANSTNTIKQTPDWLAIGSYQVQTLNSLNSAQEGRFYQGNGFFFSLTHDSSLGFQTVQTPMLNIGSNNTLSKAVDNANVRNVIFKLSDQYKMIEIVSVNSPLWKTAEKTQSRRVTFGEHLGTRTMRVRDYFSADAKLEYTEVSSYSNVDRLMINGYLQWERK
jgi:hypothetical protein